MQDIGDHMGRDRSQAGEHWKSIAQRSGIPLPPGPDPDQQAMLRGLANASSASPQGLAILP